MAVEVYNDNITIVTVDNDEVITVEVFQTGLTVTAGTWWNGSGAPSAGLGNNGDFYFDDDGPSIYGPKAGGSWGSGRLVGQGAPGPAGADGKTILSAAIDPVAGDGNDGDFFINTASNEIFGPKAGGAWPAGVSLVGPAGAQGAQGDQGPAGATGATGAAGADGADGADGKTIHNGTGVPSGALGVDGDFYLDTALSLLYGPKTGGVWGAPVSLIGPQGATGATGAAGADGADGADGKTILNGAVDPTTEGVDGDFYINTASNTLFGPKAGTWPAGVSLVGPQGATGATGATGAAGADGADGSTWHEGSGVPGAGLGIDGDFYLDDGTGDVYKKTTGAWAVVANIKGPAGSGSGDVLVSGTPVVDQLAVWTNATTIKGLPHTIDENAAVYNVTRNATWQKFVDIISAGMGVGDRLQIAMGVANSTGNKAEFTFGYEGSGNAENYFGIGLYAKQYIQMYREAAGRMAFDQGGVWEFRGDHPGVAGNHVGVNLIPDPDVGNTKPLAFTVDVNNSNLTTPTSVGFTNYAAGNAVEINFGDRYNVMANAYDNGFAFMCYHTMVFDGAAGALTAVDFNDSKYATVSASEAYRFLFNTGKSMVFRKRTAAARTAPWLVTQDENGANPTTIIDQNGMIPWAQITGVPSLLTNPLTLGAAETFVIKESTDTAKTTNYFEIKEFDDTILFKFQENGAATMFGRLAVGQEAYGGTRLGDAIFQAASIDTQAINWKDDSQNTVQSIFPNPSFTVFTHKNFASTVNVNSFASLDAIAGTDNAESTLGMRIDYTNNEYWVSDYGVQDYSPSAPGTPVENCHFNVMINGGGGVKKPFWWGRYDGTTYTALMEITTGDEIQFKKNVDVAGNITVSGTVDGRDVAADGTKLDTVESNAKDDQTGAEIKTLLAGSDALGSTNISDEAVTLAKLAHIATETILGRNTAGSGDVEALTVVQLATLLGLVPTEDTPTTVLDMSHVGAIYSNMGSANTNGTFTTTGSQDGAYRRVLVNNATRPSITGAQYIDSPDWQASTDCYMHVEVVPTRGIEYWFTKITA